MAKAKRTTARGKAFPTRDQMLEELTRFNRGVRAQLGLDMRVVHDRIGETEKAFETLTSRVTGEIKALEQSVTQRADDTNNGMLALADRIRKAEADRVTLAEALLKIGELDSHYSQELEALRERVAQLEKGLPAPAPEPTSKLNASGACVILVGAPWEGFTVHGPFLTHEGACAYQAKHLFDQNFWWVLPLERKYPSCAA